MALKGKIQEIERKALSELKAAASSRELYDLKVKYLGKQGELSLVMREMGKLDASERPAFGQLVNQAKAALEEAYRGYEDQLKSKELQNQIASSSLDLSLPGPERSIGNEHPIHRVTKEIVEILARIGYSVRTGPLIEQDWYNFEALNIPKDHPARDEQDTFYIDETHVLRTHTSPVQIHCLKNEEPPFRFLATGPVFRCDSDISHSPNFYQIECMLVDKQVSMADLRGTIAYFVREFFGPEIKTRFRPNYFPFTEPSAEMDCSCPICKGKGCRMCKGSGWVEIGGSGLINPKVFELTGVNPMEWQGFAFGFGVERMAIIKYGIEDIRLFSENDVRFLRQFHL
jgi:phenylalanyl-tRNA synthetase alpha chain